jgi:hypothetical protein
MKRRSFISGLLAGVAASKAIEAKAQADDNILVTTTTSETKPLQEPLMLEMIEPYDSIAVIREKSNRNINQLMKCLNGKEAEI